MTVADALKLMDPPAHITERTLYERILRGLIDAYETATTVCFLPWDLSHPRAVLHLRSMARHACQCLGWNPNMVVEIPSRASWVVKDVTKPW